MTTTAARTFRAFARAHPFHEAGDTWAMDCASMVYRLTAATTAYPTARIAFHSSKIESDDWRDAPVGAVHFWPDTAPPYGHVGIQVTVGGAIAMASSHLRRAYATDLGVQTIQGYHVATGASYGGWSYAYGSNHRFDVSDFGAVRAAGGLTPASTGGGHSRGWDFARPSTAVQRLIQEELTRHGRYSGPVDGAWGRESVRGIQSTLRAARLYFGPADGRPGGNTCLAVQKFAREHGYTGPLDRFLGPNSWDGFARGLA
jgi:hypothetical protein